MLPFDGFGENDAVKPVGNPDTDKVALPVKPFCGLIERNAPAEAPWPISTVPGLESVNDGDATVSVRLVKEMVFPDVPVIVTTEVPSAAELPAVSIS